MPVDVNSIGTQWLEEIKSGLPRWHMTGIVEIVVESGGVQE